MFDGIDLVWRLQLEHERARIAVAIADDDRWLDRNYWRLDKHGRRNFREIQDGRKRRLIEITEMLAQRKTAPSEDSAVRSWLKPVIA